MFSIFVVLNQLSFMNIPMLFCFSFFRIQVYLNSQYWFLSLFSNGRVTFFLPFHLNKCLPCPLHQKDGMMSRLTARYNLNPMTTDYVAALSKMASWNEINPSWLVRKTINAQTACRCHRAPNTPFVPRCHVSLPFLPWRYNPSENNMAKSMKLLEGLMSDLWLIWGISEVVKPSTSR